LNEGASKVSDDVRSEFSDGIEDAASSIDFGGITDSVEDVECNIFD
jgi:hypothetical protein